MSGFIDRYKLTDKVAIVTGAGKGIGRAIALAMADAGAHVVCAARTQSDIDDTAGQIRRRGQQALAVSCDVLKTGDLQNLVQATVNEFRRLDILVNNAGGHYNPAPAMEVSEEDFEHVVRFNLTSNFLLTQMAVREMVKTAGGGSVVNISSAACNMPLHAHSPYGAAKAGLNQLTKMLAAEFAPKVRVNGIIVGLVASPATDGLVQDKEMNETATSNIPMGRIGEPEDIAGGVVYLASPAAAWLTGKMIQIDGGAVEAPLSFPVPKL